MLTNKIFNASALNAAAFSPYLFPAQKNFFRVCIRKTENLKKSDMKPYRYPKNYVPT